MNKDRSGLHKLVDQWVPWIMNGLIEKEGKKEGQMQGIKHVYRMETTQKMKRFETLEWWWHEELLVAVGSVEVKF